VAAADIEIVHHDDGSGNTSRTNFDVSINAACHSRFFGQYPV
jgi:hypothetical protein